ncbi:MAG: hypothetical protein M1817_003601 [Caeruleum heppii]|nr:MAG: hypothetical protein M1817_003601 [Caeruleum heppii]
MDVWHNILSYCPSPFFGRARRIDKSFGHALSYRSAWHNHRLTIHPGSPDPFPGMSEERYANLLDGMGCMDCGRKDVGRTYWAWQVRWCRECLAKNTVKENGLEDFQRKYPKVLEECIRFGLADNLGNYRTAGWYPATFMGNQVYCEPVYWKADLLETLATFEPREYDVWRPVWWPQGTLPVDMQEWIRAKHLARDEHMQKAQEIERWVASDRRVDVVDKSAIRRLRITSFSERAAQLDPPLRFEALVLIEAFNRSIDIPKEPTDRAWKVLLPKLRKDQAAAEAMLAERHHRHSCSSEYSQSRAIYQSRMTMADAGRGLERFLLGPIASKVLRELGRATNPVANEDIGLIALRTIRARYYEATMAGYPGRPNAVVRPLVMEDARWLWETKITPILFAWPRIRATSALDFRCPGCSRKNLRTLYRFEQLFVHLTKTHARDVGDFRPLHNEWLQGITDFPWLNVEWPINLPMLAAHQTATGRWDPNDDSPYVPAPAQPETKWQYGFEHREVSKVGANPADVMANIIHAGKLFRDIPLEPKIKTSIVVRWAIAKAWEHERDERHVSAAIRQYTRRTPVLKSDIATIQNLPTELIRHGLNDLFPRFRCPLCKIARDRAADRVRSVGDLIYHFRMFHFERLDWYCSMMDLPSEEEIWKAVNVEGMEKALELFESLFPPRNDAAPPMSSLGPCGMS